MIQITVQLLPCSVWLVQGEGNTVLVGGVGGIRLNSDVGNRRRASGSK